jgi:hypothetical protein
MTRPMLAFLRATVILPARSQHADDDRCQEGEGDDGGEHVEPHPEGHRCFLLPE